jgi:hypothetical protein
MDREIGWGVTTRCAARGGEAAEIPDAGPHDVPGTDPLREASLVPVRVIEIGKPELMAELVADHPGRPEDEAVLALRLRHLDRLLHVHGGRTREVVGGDADPARPGRVRKNGLEVLLGHERRPDLVLAVVADVRLLPLAGVEDHEALVGSEVDRRVGQLNQVAHQEHQPLLKAVVVAVVRHGMGQREHRIDESRRERSRSLGLLLPELFLEEEEPVVVGGGGFDRRVAEGDPDREDVDRGLRAERRARRQASAPGRRQDQTVAGKTLPGSRPVLPGNGRHGAGGPRFRGRER